MIIEFPVEDLIPPELLVTVSNEATQAIVYNIAESARAYWLRLAASELFTSRGPYEDAIQEVDYDDGVATISLVGQPAMIIEEGMGRKDMRDWLLGANVPVTEPGTSGGKHRGADGSFYRSIPFRHGTPGTKGRVGTPMGDPYRNVVDKSDALGRRVYNLAKKMDPSITSMGRTIYGDRLDEEALRKIGVEKLAEHHSTSIYTGMVKMKQTYESASQTGGYMTWRTISTKSNHPDSWIRPASQGRHFAERVANQIDRLAPMAFEAYVRGIGKPNR